MAATDWPYPKLFHLRFPHPPAVTPSPFADALILTGPTASGKSALALELANG